MGNWGYFTPKSVELWAHFVPQFPPFGPKPGTWRATFAITSLKRHPPNQKDTASFNTMLFHQNPKKKKQEKQSQNKHTKKRQQNSTWLSNLMKQNLTQPVAKL